MLFRSNLTLRIAAALGKRATVWLSTHAGKDGPCPDAIARQIRMQVNVNKVEKLPATLAFFEVRRWTPHSTWRCACRGPRSQA